MVFNFSALPQSKEIDALIKPYVETKNFSGSVLVAQNSKTVFSKTYAQMNRSYSLPNTTQTKFYLASVSMIFTSAATKEEIDFADKIMKEYGAIAKGINGDVKPLEKIKEDRPGGSTDVGDNSHIVPQLTLFTTTSHFESSRHSWVVVACSGMSIGQKGMIYASKALALTMVDFLKASNYARRYAANLKSAKEPMFGKQFYLKASPL